MLNHARHIAVLGSAALLLGASTALAAQGPTEITVDPATTVKAGEKSPFDAPGVRAIRRGKPIPKGYVLVGRKVQVKRGKNAAGAALPFRCPGTKRLRTFGLTGRAGFVAPRDYVGHRSTIVISLPSGRLSRASGTVYAVCR